MASSTFTWNGFAGYFDDPVVRAAGSPWVVVAPTYYNGYWQTGIPTQLITQLLAAGQFVIGLNMPGLDGSQPDYGAQYTQLNAFIPWAVAHFALGAKPALYAQSKGGLPLLPWARDNPNAWTRLAMLYAACDPLSYPGASPALFAACGVPDLATFQASVEPTHNAINGAGAIAGSRVKMWAGNADGVVPYSANGQLFGAACGAEARIISGMGHVGYINQDIGNHLIGKPMAPIGTDFLRLEFTSRVNLPASGSPLQLFPDNIVSDPNTLYNPTTGLITVKNSRVYTLSTITMFDGMQANNTFWAGIYNVVNGGSLIPLGIDTKVGISGTVAPQASEVSVQVYLSAGDKLAWYVYNNGLSGVSIDSTGFANFLTLAGL